MPRTWLWTLLPVAVAAALWAGHEARKQEDIDVLVARADHLLHESTRTAPELRHLEAARARMCLDEALAIDEREDLRGLRHLYSALAYLQKGDLSRSSDRLDKAEAALGPTADVLSLRAALQHSAGEWDAAEHTANSALKLAPKHLRARVLLVDLALDANDADRALSLLSALLRDEPDSAALRNRHGIAMEMRGELARARRDFETAARLDARLAAPQLNLGRVLRLSGEPEQAVRVFLTATRLDPNEPAAHLGLGLCRLDLGDVHGARNDFERAHSLGDGDPRALLSLGDLDLAEGDRERAEGRYRAALALDPKSPRAWVKLGNVLAQMGDYPGAVIAFRRAIDQDPGVSAAHNGLGAVLSLLGEREEAALALATAANLDRSDPNPWLNLARLHKRSGDLDQARQALAAARERNPQVRLAGL